jgi:hypothetical protein
MARRRTKTRRSTSKRRFQKAGFNTKLIMDVGLAGIATRILPMVVNKFLPLDPTLYAVVGAGGTYVVGSIMKKPDLANAGIALGLVEFVTPMIEDLIGGMVGTSPAATISPSGLPMPIRIKPPSTESTNLSDYLNLNDYIATPGMRQGVDEYRSSY